MNVDQAMQWNMDSITNQQLSRIEQEFVTGDPSLVRAATFKLLHVGCLQAPQLHTQPLSYLTHFAPPVRLFNESSSR